MFCRVRVLPIAKAAPLPFHKRRRYRLPVNPHGGTDALLHTWRRDSEGVVTDLTREFQWRRLAR